MGALSVRRDLTMTQRPNQLRNAAKQRLLAGLPAEDADLGSWKERPYSIQQLSALLDAEITQAHAEKGSLAVFRIRHRPFGIVDDGPSAFGQLRPELLAALHRAHSGIRAIGSPQGEVVGFALGYADKPTVQNYSLNSSAFCPNRSKSND